MSDNLFKINERKDLVVELAKNAGLGNQKASILFVLDYSGSMSTLYASGKIQELIERILPVGMGFDDNGEVDFYIFSDHYHKLSPISLSNFDNYIKSKVIPFYSMGSTSYSPVINAIVDTIVAKRGGFLGMGGKEASQTLDYPLYVIFVTDGDNSDHPQTEAAIKRASNHGVFFQFIGIGRSGFPFLEKLDNLSGRLLDNANFFKVPDLSATTDQQLYSLLLTEFPSWVSQARQKQLIK